MSNTETNKSNLPEFIPETKDKSIIVIQDKSKQPLIANIIAAAAVLISGFLFYYTYQLFKETQKATDISAKSAEAATSAVAEQKRMDSFSIESQKKSSYQDSINQEKNFNIQQNSLKQAQTDFEKENRPVLKFLVYYISSKDFNKNRVKIAFGFYNMGKFPAYNIRLSSSVAMGQDTIHNLGKVNATGENFDYLPGGSKSDTLEMVFNTTDTLANVVKKNSFFFFMNIKYQCPILNQTYHTYAVYQCDFTSMKEGYFYPIQIKENNF